MQLKVALVLVATRIQQEVGSKTIVYDGFMSEEVVGEDYTGISPWLESEWSWDKVDGKTVVPYYFTSEIDIASANEAKRIMKVFEENVCVRFEEVHEPSDKLLRIGLTSEESRDKPCSRSRHGIATTNDNGKKTKLEMSRNYCDLIDFYDDKTIHLSNPGSQITKGRDCWIKGSVLIENKVERCTKNILDFIEEEFVEGMLCKCVLEKNNDKKMKLYYTYDERRDKWSGTFTHEMFHIFGIKHTQKRSDRDKYVEVLCDNVETKFHSQYEKCEECEILPGSKYECNSIMHYKDTTLAKDEERPTMVSRDEELCPSKHLKEGGMVPTANDWMTLRNALKC